MTWSGGVGGGPRLRSRLFTNLYQAPTAALIKAPPHPFHQTPGLFTSSKNGLVPPTVFGSDRTEADFSQCESVSAPVICGLVVATADDASPLLLWGKRQLCPIVPLHTGLTGGRAA